MEKRQLDEFKRLIRGTLIGILLFVLALMFSYTWNHYYSQGLWIEPFYNKGNYIIVVIYFILGIVFFSALGGTKIGYLRRTNVMLSQIVAITFVNALVYIQIILLYRHLPDMGPMIGMTAVEWIIIFGASYITEGFINMIFPPRKLLVIYEEYPLDSIKRKIQSRGDKFEIAEQVKVGENPEEIYDKIDEYKDGIFVSDVHSEKRNKILKYCYSKGIRIYTTPKISDILMHNAETLHIFDTPLMLVRANGLTIGQRFAKRALDLVASLLMTIVASPFMLFTAILIKAYDRGPVLFKQKRLTLNGKEFYVYKFRSMIVDAEKDGVARLATANDSRITPVGKFIRATRLDELPQLFNILKGDMSLVGPRPERPEIAVEYEKEIPEFAYRLKVKAGLTGYAQVYGKYNTTAYDKLKLDLMYIEGYTFFSDLKLILTTAKIMFMKESTEGLDDGKTISK